MKLSGCQYLIIIVYVRRLYQEISSNVFGIDLLFSGNNGMKSIWLTNISCPRRTNLNKRQIEACHIHRSTGYLTVRVGQIFTVIIY